MHPYVSGGLMASGTVRRGSVRGFSSTKNLLAESSENTQVTFSRRPGRGERATYDCFGVRAVDEPQDIVAQSIANTVVCETLILSVDPYLRCRMNDDTGVDYTHPYTIGEAMSSGGVGRVIQSTRCVTMSNARLRLHGTLDLSIATRCTAFTDDH
jgi:hypothetical protein